MAFRFVGNRFVDANDPQFDMYNALGRNGGQEATGNSDNFFVKRGKSIENAVGTTLAAPISFANDRIHQMGTEQLLKDNQTKMQDIVKKYGYSSLDDYYDALDAAEAKEDKTEYNNFMNTIQKELQNQANANVDAMKQRQTDYEDYRNNNYISQKINQDPGKFAGSAINTLSTMTDVMLPGAGIALNAAQGVAEGYADELEQNGLQNFDWNRANQNALIGGVTGGVTGAFNKGLSNSLAKKGGNLFKGGNRFTNWMNETGAKHPIMATLATGAGRGALSGAVGGATGGGLSAQLNGGNFLEGAARGAVQGAQSGAVTGATMAGANMALNATPGVGKAMQKINQAGADWENGGDNFKERWDNARSQDTWGNRFLDNRVEDATAIKQGFQNVGEGLGVLARKASDKYNDWRAEPAQIEDFGKRYTQFAGEPKKARDYLMRRKQGEVPRASYNESLKDATGDGFIDYAYGRPGEGEKFSNGMALSHIQAKHGDEALARVPYNTENGTIEKVLNDRVYLKNDANNDRTVIRTNWTDNDGNVTKKQWLDTSFDKEYPAPRGATNRNSSTAGSSVVSDTGDAPVSSIIPQAGQDVNTKAYWEQEMKALDAEGVPFTSPRYQAAMDEWKKAPETVSPNLQSGTILQDIQNMRVNDNTGVQSANEFDFIFEDARGNRARLPELRKTLNPDSNTVIANSELIDDPMRGRMYDNMSNNEFIKYAERNGWELASTPYDGMPPSEMLNTMAKNAGFEDYGAAVRKFTDTGETVKGTDIVDWMENRSKVLANTPETEVYRTLTGESAQPSLAYGESELGNRTRRGMVADSLERFGNTLEGAQTNVTRAAAKDLGIESTGKVVENVRKKTGITNLETQAKLAKELTGGDNSLMDNIQRQALNASESGKPYKVDTTPILSKVDAIVDKYADTNMFGSTNARNKFISNLKRDISNFDSDVLSIANRMKANAADLRGKGVASPTPADSAKAKIYTEIANKLDDLSYKAIPQENVEAMFDATISEMRGRANQAKQNGNNDVASAYTKLADSLNSEPRTIKAFRSFKKDFVDVSKVSELTNRAENGAAVQMGRGFGGGVKRFLGTVAQRPVNATLAKAGGAVNKLADKIAGEGTPTPTPATETTSTNYNPATQIYNAIGRTEGATNAEQTRTANYLANAVQNANTLEDLAGAGYTDPSMSVYNSVYGEPTSTSGDYWTSVLSDAMEMARKAGDATAFGQLYSMYQDAVGSQAKTTTNKLTDKQRQANAAARALDDMVNAENNFAYDISDIPIIGSLANITGNDYKAKAEALALQVGYMLSGATVNAQEAKNIGMAYVPQPRENETERKRKLAQLREIISDYQQTYAE